MKLVLFANTDWYLYNFRRSLALELCARGHNVLLISPPGPYGPQLQALGIPWQPIQMDRRSLNPFREATLLYRLVAILRDFSPDLVHGFTIKCAIYGAFAAQLAKVPFRVSAIAGMGYVFTSNELKARLLRPCVRMLLRLALGGRGSRVIVQNPDDKLALERYGLVDPEQVRSIPGSGVDMSRFKKASGAAGRSEKVVLLASRLLWDKGVAEYVAAAKRLRGGGAPLRFLLAGAPDPGNPASVPECAIREWVSQGLIEWLGHVDAMPDLLSQVDIVVLPSYREGLPKSLIEAAACGLPLVTTDVPGCREVVRNEVNGLLVPPQDSDALAGAIARLSEDAELAQRLGDAARVTALSTFDEKIIIGSTIAVYRELLGLP